MSHVFLSQPNPICLGPSRVLTPVSWQMSLSLKKCLDCISGNSCVLAVKACYKIILVVLCSYSVRD